MKRLQDFLSVYFDKYTESPLIWPYKDIMVYLHVHAYHLQMVITVPCGKDYMDIYDVDYYGTKIEYSKLRHTDHLSRPAFEEYEEKEMPPIVLAAIDTALPYFSKHFN